MIMPTSINVGRTYQFENISYSVENKQYRKNISINNGSSVGNSYDLMVAIRIVILKLKNIPRINYS